MKENAGKHHCPVLSAARRHNAHREQCSHLRALPADSGPRRDAWWRLLWNYFGSGCAKPALSLPGPWILPGQTGRDGEGRGAGRGYRDPPPPLSPAPGRLSPAPGSLPGPRPVGASARALTPSRELRPRRSHPRPGAGDAAGRRTEPAPVALPRTPPR